MRLLMLAIALGVMLVMVGCSSRPFGPTFMQMQSDLKPNEGQALLIVYRTFGFKGAVWDNHLYINGDLAAKIPHTSYTYFRLVPGEYVIDGGPPGSPKAYNLNLKADPGAVYYVEYYSPDSLAASASDEGLSFVQERWAIEAMRDEYRLTPPIVVMPSAMP